MENWNQRILLGTALAVFGVTPAWGELEQDQEQVIFPDVERRVIKPAEIDTEDFEVGGFAGIISIQDFNSEVVYGVRAAWHVTEDFFFEASYGESEGDLTSYEKLSGGSPLFDDNERDYSYYGLALGWNILPGEIFLFDDRALKSDLYLIGGAGSTDFLGDNWFTASVGVGYRLLLNDAFSWRIDVRDHIYDRDAFGEDETVHNLEWTTGLTFFF